MWFLEGVVFIAIKKMEIEAESQGSNSCSGTPGSTTATPPSVIEGMENPSIIFQQTEGEEDLLLTEKETAHCSSDQGSDEAIWREETKEVSKEDDLDKIGEEGSLNEILGQPEVSRTFKILVLV